jgi:lipoprotein-anchoring transpeptidase ErfK/SrfK
MDINQSDLKRKPRVRDRVAQRRTRQSPFAFLSNLGGNSATMARAPRWARQRRPETPVNANTWHHRLRMLVKDAWWYTLHRPYVLQGIIALLVGLFVVYILSHTSSGVIFPNVWSLGLNLGEMNQAQAERALQNHWRGSMTIDLTDGERKWTVRPADIGLSLDAVATIERARSVGMAGMPFGYSVEPVVNVDVFTAQNYLLNLTEDANYAPYNAGYIWQGDTLVGKPGAAGAVLDVGLTVERLQKTPDSIADQRQIELVMNALPPLILDPEPYLPVAEALTQQTFTLTGYDPFTDEYVSWATDRDTFTSWLEVRQNGLGLREDLFAEFIRAQNATLNPEPDGVRYLEPTETMSRVESAIQQGTANVTLRIRYRPQTYEIARGDTGYQIASRLGMPFYTLTTFNPGVEWERLSIGDRINLPSRDVTLPLDVVPAKRIIVNIDTQSLVAYENGQEVFRWLISTGTADFPTYAGIFQILSHNETAFGSTFELCGSSGCGQWEMYWFMGIYEVVPGLMNGFHGAVLLPNGAYLGGGTVGYPYTYGCVMSENSNAQKLFEWADAGTVVEIIGRGFPPQSELARDWVAQGGSA